MIEKFELNKWYRLKVNSKKDLEYFKYLKTFDNDYDDNRYVLDGKYRRCIKTLNNKTANFYPNDKKHNLVCWDWKEIFEHFEDLKSWKLKKFLGK